MFVPPFRSFYFLLVTGTILLIIISMCYKPVEWTILQSNQVLRNFNPATRTIKSQPSTAPVLEIVTKINRNFSKPFLYLTQAEQCILPLKASAKQIGDSKTCNCDVIVLSYKKECGEKNQTFAHITYLFDPTTTWASGRNALYNAAMKRKQGYHYYIFIDGDTVFGFNGFTPQEMKRLPPFRVFEDWLLDYEPALGVADYWRLTAAAAIQRRKNLCRINEDRPTVVPVVWFDGCFNAFHYKAISHILPYPNLDREKSWYIPNRHIMSAMELKFGGQAMMFVPLTIVNLYHTDYPKRTTPGEMQEYWRKFIDNIHETAPLVYKNNSKWEEFKTKLDRYMDTSMSHCMNVARHLPIVPYAHFARKRN